MATTFSRRASVITVAMLVGLAVDLHSLIVQWPMILLTVVLVQTARAIAVHTLVPFTTWLFRRPAVSRAERHVMWWGGLKGGLAVAMVLSIPPSLPERQRLLDLTVGVVLTLLLVNASTLRALMRRLGLTRMSRGDRAELVEAVTRARARVVQRLAGFREAGVVPAANASDGAGPSTPIPLPSQRLPDSQMPQRNALKTAPTLGKLPTTPRIVPKKLAPNSPRVVASNAKKAKLACAANAGAATERLPAKPKVPREAERSPTDDDAAMAAALFRSMNGLRAR